MSSLSVKQLRTLCNALNVSCMDKHGNYLEKSELVEILAGKSQSGGAGDDPFEAHFRENILKEYIRDLTGPVTGDANALLYEYGNSTEYELRMIADNEPAESYMYTGAHRIDMSGLRCYSVDPQGSEDADDAFSVYEGTDGKLYLAIHIADPTAFIDPLLPLWEYNIRRRVVTRYPSNTKPFHMLPRKILNKCTLMTDSIERVWRPALTYRTEIDRETKLPVGSSYFNVSHVKICKADHFTYDAAAALEIQEIPSGVAAAVRADLNNQAYRDFELCKEIATALRTARGGHLVVDPVVERYGDKLIVHSAEVMQMKNVIEEFAILMNVAVGNFLFERDEGIFRLMSKAIDAETRALSGQDLIDKLTDLGAYAQYTGISGAAAHSLIGNKIYSHSTSPMRRSTDCVIHYLLKSFIIPGYKDMFFQSDPRTGFVVNKWPFTGRYISSFAEEASIKTKHLNTKVSKLDQKFRFAQYIRKEIGAGSTVSCIIVDKGCYNEFQNIMIKSFSVTTTDGDTKTYKTFISYTHHLPSAGQPCRKIEGEHPVDILVVNPDEVKIKTKDNEVFPNINDAVKGLINDILTAEVEATREAALAAVSAARAAPAGERGTVVTGGSCGSGTDTGT